MSGNLPPGVTDNDPHFDGDTEVCETCGHPVCQCEPLEMGYTTCSALGTDGRAKCDDGFYCEKHGRDAAAEMAWMARVPLSAVTGKLSDEDKQDLRDAGRGHLLPPE